MINCTKIYIRHAEKKYKNGFSNKHKFDPQITDNGEFNTEILAQKLLKLYGKPDIIICSPYLRTRQTASILRKMADENIEILYDVHLSEYLGNHQSDILDVHPETKKYKPPHPENFKQFCYRIRHHDNYTKKLTSLAQKNGINIVIWIVTHGIVINQLARLYGMKRNKQVENLSGIIINDYTIQEFNYKSLLST